MSTPQNDPIDPMIHPQGNRRLEVDSQTRGRRLDRRSFLKLAAGGTLVAVVAGDLTLGRGRNAKVSRPITLAAYKSGALKQWTIVATDGFVSMPDAGLITPMNPYWPDVLAYANTNTYIFGFTDVTDIAGFAALANLPSGFDASQLVAPVDFKGFAQLDAPLLYCDEGDDVRLTVRNEGFAVRPDLFDNHTVHWHGFPNQIPYFDGVPDASIGIPDGNELTYQFIPEDPGTYMYHCHVEDVEHVTMGLHGSVFVRPKMGKKFAYNDASTAFDRQFAILLTDIDVENHFNDAHIQVSDWSQYRSTFGLMNGRAWPDTIEPNGPFYDRDTNAWRDSQLSGVASDRLGHNPLSSLIQANAGEKVLIRIANLGFDEKSLLLPNIPVRIVGRDAKPMGTGRIDYDYTGSRGDITATTNRIDLGPGESRDVIFTAPPTASVNANAPDVYPFYDRAILYRAKQAGVSDPHDGIGQTRTEVHVYPAGSLGPQLHPNQLFARPNGQFHS